MANPRRLVELGMVPPLAKEVAKQIDTAGAPFAVAGSAADFQQPPLSVAPDGVVIEFNGVQFVKDASANIPGLVAGAGWGILGEATDKHFLDLSYAALHGGRIAIVSDNILTATLVMGDGLSLEASGGSITFQGTGAALDMSGATGASILGLRMEGNKDSNPGVPFIDMTGAKNCRVVGGHIANAPSAQNGSVRLQAAKGCTVEGVILENCEENGIVLVGSGADTASNNKVVGNEFRNSGGFNILLRSGSKYNEVSRNVSFLSGIEPIGVQYGAEFNRIAFNVCERSGDNGISISGDYNVVIGNQCRYNYKAGIFVWGSKNSITGNTCVGNDQEGGSTIWPGIGVSANYGGCGQFNVITGNVIDDDQEVPTQKNALRFSGSAYLPWMSGQTIASNAIYRVHGLNVYVSTAGGVCGETPPTHLAGTVSDGGVTWRYVSSFISAAYADNNRALENSIIRVAPGSSPIVDATISKNNSWSSRTKYNLPTELDVAGSKVLTRADILGTASMAAGVPSGTILEAGGDANSRYVRYADGTQILTRTGLLLNAPNVADGALFKGGDVAFTFFKNFASPPTLLAGQCTDPDIFATPVTTTAGQGTLRPRSTLSKSDGGTVSVVLIGRWA